MEMRTINGISCPNRPKWRKIAYGEMQPGFEDNHTYESFSEDMSMNASVVRRDLLKVMLDSISISQYLCIVAVMVLVWIYTLGCTLTEDSLLLLDISFFIIDLYLLSPIYHILTCSISLEPVWVLRAALIILLLLHNYSGSIVNAPGTSENPTFTSNISLNASIVAWLLVGTRLPSRRHVFAIVLFSLQVFLFAPLVTYWMRKLEFRSTSLRSMVLGMKLNSALTLQNNIFVACQNILRMITPR
ncbi:hypothetical protein ACH5RR_018484, partial [Cinchona calisaya]